MMNMEPQGGFSYSEADFRRVQEIARQEAGISLPISKRSLVFSRVSRRIRATGRASFRDYLDYVSMREGQEELKELICVLTTNVTQFFREKSHFEHLETHVLPQLGQKLRAGGRGRFWSAACSTGQEPWSMAMSIMAELPDALRMDLKILATDINHAVVETGRIGQYPGEEVQSVPQRWRDAYMEPVEMAQFSMVREIRRLVTFRQLNLN
ncbi:CheR family methyltransferase, partial [Bombella apis]|uniref:CheR family methyltransferase n=1 Tax=Bombella apis TaxID=1785988 RepID=UPI0023F8D85A